MVDIVEAAEGPREIAIEVTYLNTRMFSDAVLCSSVVPSLLSKRVDSQDGRPPRCCKTEAKTESDRSIKSAVTILVIRMENPLIPVRTRLWTCHSHSSTHYPTAHSSSNMSAPRSLPHPAIGFIWGIRMAFCCGWLEGPIVPAIWVMLFL